MRRSLSLVSLYLVVTACTHSPKVVEQKAPAPLLSAWIQYGPDSTVHARAAVSTPQCPEVTNGNLKIAMTARAQASADFPYLVCDATIAAGASKVSVLGHDLPVPHKDINKIVIIGDTGCRLRVFKDGNSVIQSCGSLADWPFKTVIESAAAFGPDLVIHVGDYHYRESQCPAGNPNCALVGIPETSGDRWESWNEDFLTPAATLLQKAPWVFVRGNHELCPRGGTGWNTILSPYPFTSACSDNMAPYTIQAGDQRLLVVDAADDANEDPSFKKLVELVKGADFKWLLLHRPFLTPGADDEAKHKGNLPKSLLKAGTINAVFTGHVHTSSINQFTDSRPPEIISGNGGTKLDKRNFSGIKGVTATEYKDFGFLALTKKSAGEWKMDVNDRDGKPIWLCDLKQARKVQTKIICKSASSK